MASRVCEYMIFIKGEPQGIIFARVQHPIDDALHILNKHRGQSILREDVTMKSRSRVSKKLWVQIGNGSSK